MNHLADESRKDVQVQLANIYQACTTVIRTRDENLNQWNGFYDTLSIRFADEPQTLELIEGLRDQLETNLPRINIEECAPVELAP